MKFDAALEALAAVTWDWSEAGFEQQLVGLGLAREPDADAEMPSYESPWGKEWVQAIVDEGEVERVEFLVEDTSPGWRNFTARKLAALAKKYRAKLAAYVKRASAVLGAPTFYGDQDTAGFPDDEEAYVLAMWRRESARVMLTARNEGPDTPFWISIVIKPSSTARAPTGRQSRPVLRAPTRQSSMVLSVAATARFDYAIKTIRATRWDWSPQSRATVLAQLAPASADDEGNRIELTIESTLAKTTSGGEQTELDREYCQKFETYVERARRVLGKPKFNDGMSRRGFPKDEKAELLALWPLKKARLMVMFRNEGPESPFSIAIVVKP